MRTIALDGPSGAGKSTVAKLVAKQLGIHYVETGAMYRTLGWYLLQEGVCLSDEAAVEDALSSVSATIQFSGGVQRMYIAGQDVTDLLRAQDVGEAASKIAVYPCVRDKLLGLQRELAVRYDVIMDGRDIGTAVLPDAGVKIYLTASVEERARRRYQELCDKGETGFSQEAIQEEIASRDYRDTHRAIAPLRQAEDAVMVDSTQLTVQEVVDRICTLAGGKVS